jgi:peptide deformylase
MALLEILKYPDSRLSKVARPVSNVTDATVQLIGDMLETMYAAPGVGLAATQIGMLQLINPVITHSEGKVIWEEGCLSVVDFTAEVSRAEQVQVVALDERGNERKIEAEGLLAVALQHEIDHLDGKLFIDRISRLKRDLYTRRRKKMLRSGIEPPESAQVMI